MIGWRGIGVLVAMLAATACGDGSDGGGSDDDVVIDVEITDEGITAPDRPQIELGSEVVIVFTADLRDDAHLHGYDLWSTVGPDQENLIEFTADVPGVFLLELEEEFAYIAELVVQ